MSAITIEAVEYHRNGVGGEPFYACTFIDPDNDGARFLAVVFPPDPIEGGEMEGEPDWTYRQGFHNPRVAVLRVDLLPSVEFGHNSWRGDNYADALYHAIMEGIGARV